MPLARRSALIVLLALCAACAGPDGAAPAAPPAAAATAQTGPAAASPAADEIPAPASPANPSSQGTATHRVRQVIDGDTITVSGIGTVRLLGVDAPEKTGGLRPPEPFGDEATRFMRALVEGQLVRLEYDGERLDQFKRTLAYVILEDGRVANEEIIRAGWAQAYRRFDYWRKPAFQAAEREARTAKRGMWKTK